MSKNSKNFDSFKVYIIKCFNKDEEFYKIGRTYTKIKKRFGTKLLMPYKYEVLNEFIGTAEEMYDLETKLKNMNKNNKYLPKIKFGGMQECFKEIKKNIK